MYACSAGNCNTAGGTSKDKVQREEKKKNKNKKEGVVPANQKLKKGALSSPASQRKYHDDISPWLQNTIQRDGCGMIRVPGCQDRER